jgi:hypothetical protein
MKKSNLEFKSIGIQNEIHWILKRIPLEFKVKSNGVESEVQWN